MRRAVAVSFFPAFHPASSGGELRLHGFHSRLAKAGWEVRLHTPTYSDHKPETIRHSERFTEQRHPKTPLYNRLHRLNDCTARFPECSGLVCSLAAPRHPALREAIARDSAGAQLIIHESPFLASLLPRRTQRGQSIIYNSYNCEAKLARDLFPGMGYGLLARRRIAVLERELCRRARLIFACSEEDAEDLCREVGADGTRITIVPNAIDPAAHAPISEAERREARAGLAIGETQVVALFVGSNHPPNATAARFIVEYLAPKNLSIEFLLVGSVGEAIGDPLPRNVRRLGRVPVEELRQANAAADVILNPMSEGSGTNLKMLEALALAQPVLTTPFGARGLNVLNGRHAAVEELTHFHEALQVLSADPERRREIAHAGRDHVVEHFSWDRVMEGALDRINQSQRRERRVVVACDYPVAGCLNGGAMRVAAVAQAARRSGHAVTLLTIGPHSERARRENLADGVEEIRVPRPGIIRVVDSLLQRLVGCSADDTSTLLFGRMFLRDYRRRLRKAVRRAPAVLLEHPYLLPLLPETSTPIFFDAHNDEAALKSALYQPTSGALPRRLFTRWMVARVRHAEEQSTRRALATFAVCGETAHALAPFAPTAPLVAPNGVNARSVKPLNGSERAALRELLGANGGRRIAVFLGSSHPPNGEAMRFISEQVAPALPQLIIVALGTCRDWLDDSQIPENVIPLGPVSDDAKRRILLAADVALNPMRSGAGTSLKVFDYLAHGLPVLSTTVGARGLAVESPALPIASLEDYTAQLARLLADQAALEALRPVATHLAQERFDWSMTLRPIETTLAAISPKGP